MPVKPKMTAKQKRFVEEYLVDMNATQAAIRSGYSEKTAKSIGQENLTKPNIKAQIDEQLKALESESIAGAGEVLRHLTAVMRGSLTEQVPLLCGDGCQTLVDKNAAVKDRIKAAELLGKRYGLFDKSTDAAQTAINDFVKALQSVPGDVAALYAHEADDGTEE